MSSEGQLRAWLEGIAALGGMVSAAEALVACEGRILFRHAAGFRVGGERLVAASGARFDAASLTKPWMATLALALDAAGDLRLSTSIGALAPGAAPALAGRPLEDLLRHRAGLPGWTPVALRLGARLGEPEDLVRYLSGQEPSTAGGVPLVLEAGEERSTYSDLGYLLWGLLAERATGSPLGLLLAECVCAPLGLPDLFRASLEPPRAVECRLDNGKEVELAAEQGLTLRLSRSFHQGVPQDGNARALRAVGITSAHAGLFVTADEMLALASEWLRPSRLLNRRQVDHALAGRGPYALGWARWSEDGSAGPALGTDAFGHTGFTGGSVWIEPEAERITLLLAHRLRASLDFNPFRREFHRLAVALT